MLKEIFIIGIGGQGALTTGEVLCYAGVRKGYEVSFYPFYGSQMRGGEAGVVVKIDTDGNEIANPTVNRPDDFVILSDKFFDKYRRFAGDDSRYFEAPEDGVRDKNLNLKMLKKYIDETELFDEETMKEALRDKFRKPEVYEKKLEIYLGE